MRFYNRRISAVDVAIGIYIRAEVAAGHRLPNCTLGLRHIRSIDDGVVGRIADEHGHAHLRVRQRL